MEKETHIMVKLQNTRKRKSKNLWRIGRGDEGTGVRIISDFPVATRDYRSQ